MVEVDLGAPVAGGAREAHVARVDERRRVERGPLELRERLADLVLGPADGDRGADARGAAARVVLDAHAG